MKSHMLLLRTVLNEMGTRCCTSTTLDLKRIERRVSDEGLSFLTITLPNFCTDFERGLDRGKVDSSLFVGFSKRGCLPNLFSGFTSQVFDRSTGVLLQEPDIDAIQSIRQVCLLFGKIGLPCSDARTAKAFKSFLECEHQVTAHCRRMDPSDIASFRSMALRIFGDVFAYVDREIHLGNVVPKHGPGSTADKLFGNEKYNQRVWTERLEDNLFYAGEFLFPSWSHYDPELVTWLDPDQELPVRVVSVPKTLKTPRIIAIEPTCMQYVQQGLMELIRVAIDRDNLLSQLVGFDDQIPNREMARIGSVSSELATLDLKEASDRVSNQLVLAMMSDFPWLSGAIQASRSRNADVPGYGTLSLSKFASMGSALCFPVEMIVFMTIILLGIEEELGTQLSRKQVENLLLGKVRVFGDDIIVPVDYVHTVIEKLEAFGLIVNSNKSFWTGKFRESCGKEYYDGSDVSIVRVRTVLPTSRHHASEIISTVSLRNQMYFAGNWETVKFLDKWLERLIPFPTVSTESPGLGRHTFLSYDSNKREKVCPDLQRPLVWAFRESSKSPPSFLEDSGALLKYFLKRTAEPSADKKHLERAGRPKRVNIKLGWVLAD
jgi:hypothetical protein